MEAGKRAPRRQTPGADYPRLGTTTVMFIGRNGGKRKLSQKVRKRKGKDPPTIFSRYLKQARPAAGKRISVVMDDEDTKRSLIAGRMLAR